jgi:dTDP-6-deoxy-L-talose 4-dehydrogenase (NAD+)
MKVLVTGATGFIGRHVIPALLKEGHEVVATSRNRNKAMLDDWFGLVKYVSYDIANKNSHIELFKFFGQPDCLIHLAWEGVDQVESLIHIERNLIQHYDFLKGLITGGLKKLVVIGTCLEYGFRSGELDESMETRPHVSYALAKDSLHKFLLLLQKTQVYKLTWIRLFYMYGSGQHSRSLLAQLEKAIESGASEFNMSQGDQERDYLPVEKVAEFIVKVAHSNQDIEVINCCSGVPITVKALVKQFLTKYDRTDMHLNLGFYPYKVFESKSFWGDNRRMKDLGIK